MTPRRLRSSLAIATLLFAGVAFAQSYPDKPVRMVVPFPAGATMDFAVRLVANRLGEDWGKPVVVENRTGGAGVIGTDAVAKSAPDGYTVLAVANSFAGNPAFRSDLPYDTFRDFAPITLLGATPLVLVGHPSVAAKTTPELVQLARTAQPRLTYGAASGASPHLAMAWFRTAAGVELQFVPYRGQAQAQTDLLSGQIQLVFGNLPDIAPHVKSGKLRAFGIATRERSPLAPDIPTLAEAGYKGPEWDSWYGFVVPAKTPAEVVDRLAAGIRAALARPELREKLASVGLAPVGNSPDAFGRFLQETAANYAKIIKDNAIKPE